MRAYPFAVVALFSGVAAAQAMDSVAALPTWQTIALAAVSICSGLVAAYARGIKSSIMKVETDLLGRMNHNSARITAVEHSQMKDFHTKPEIREAMTSALAPMIVQIESLRREVRALQPSSRFHSDDGN